MKRIIPVTLILFFCVLNFYVQAQNATAPGTVWRITYVEAFPGKANDVLTDMRQNILPIMVEYKKQGLIVDYKFYSNMTSNSPEDWTYAFATGYRNWAALDEFGAKAEAIRLKHYGSREKMQEAITKRAQNGKTFASKLIRELTLNPMP